MKVNKPKIKAKVASKKPVNESMISDLTYYFCRDGSYSYNNPSVSYNDLQMKEYTFVFGLMLWFIGHVYFEVKVPHSNLSGNGIAVVNPLENTRRSESVFKILKWLGLAITVEGIVNISTDHQVGNIKLTWGEPGRIDIQGGSQGKIYVQGGRRRMWCVNKLIKGSTCVGWSFNASKVNNNKGLLDGLEQKTA